MAPDHTSHLSNEPDIVPPSLHGRVKKDLDAAAETVPLTSGPAYLNSLNYFRGLAILFIIAGHCFQLSGWHVDAFYEKMIVNFIKGGTAFFVFISGFLFHHIFAPHFRYRRFMKKKMSNVLLPYVIVSALPLIYYVLIRQGGPHADLIYSGGEGMWAQYLQPVLKYLWTGRLFDAYWYIPFIIVVFALSPVFLAYLRLPLRARLAMLGGTLVIALLIHRPLHNISVAQSVIYFLPVYLMGMNVSMDKEKVLKNFTGREWLIALMMLGLCAEQVALYAEYSNLHKPALAWAGLDILLIQKMLGCLFFYVLLNRFENRHWPWLKTLAASSFALYFLHPPVILLIKKSGVLDMPLLHQIPGIVAWGLWCGVVTVVTFGLAWAVRKSFPKNSRRVIGW